MQILTDTLPQEQALRIEVQGRFDYNAHAEFRSSYEDIKAKPEVYLVDLNKTSFLDSSALGMLLLLRKHAEAHEANVKLVNPNPAVMEILEVSSFAKLFNIVTN